MVTSTAVHAAHASFSNKTSTEVLVISISLAFRRPHVSGKADTSRVESEGGVTIHSCGMDSNCLCFFSAARAVQCGLSVVMELAIALLVSKRRRVVDYLIRIIDK